MNMKIMRSSLLRFACLPAVLAFLAVPAPLFAKKTVYVVEEPVVVVEDTAVTTEDPIVTEEEPVVIVEGPLLDKMSDSGALYGDLYRIARYKGGEMKNVPLFKSDGTPDYEWVPWVDPDGIPSAYPVARQKWTTATAVGGEPILTEEFAVYTIIDEETRGILSSIRPRAISTIPPRCQVNACSRWPMLSAGVIFLRNLISATTVSL